MLDSPSSILNAPSSILHPPSPILHHQSSGLTRGCQGRESAGSTVDVAGAVLRREFGERGPRTRTAALATRSVEPDDGEPGRKRARRRAQRLRAARAMCAQLRRRPDSRAVARSHRTRAAPQVGSGAGAGARDRSGWRCGWERRSWVWTDPPDQFGVLVRRDWGDGGRARGGNGGGAAGRQHGRGAGCDCAALGRQ
eukprot:1321733-Rhodomonas_salina.1